MEVHARVGMFNGESKKRPTVSLRGKSKDEDRDRGEFLRRARVSNRSRTMAAADERARVAAESVVLQSKDHLASHFR